MTTQTALKLALGTAIGLLIGIGIYTFVYANGASYLTNDPGACANCHIMQPYYDGWLVSPHHAVAVCNDCHTPPGLVPKYATKASNGFHHSYAFTTGWFHEPLMITARNREVTEKACRNCHQMMVLAIEGGVHEANQQVACIRCHSDVGHP